LKIDTADPDCSSALDNEYPAGYGACSDGIDNDLDGKIDSSDPECTDYYYESKATMIAQQFFLRDRNDETSDGSGDAIALRVYTNPELLSARDWYYRYAPNVGKTNPTEISLGCFTDSFYNRESCYYGVQNGNTMYISAGDLDGSQLYNYIYVLAYSLESNSVTTDIFSQILNHVSFNNNISNANKKWTIKRDIKRLNDVVSIKDLLVKYFQSKGSLPEIFGGSYIKNIVVSSWPSWQSELSTILGSKLPVDPLNYFEQYFPLSTNTGTVCGSDVYCQSLDDQCIDDNLCSVCAPGSDVNTCYNSETLQFGMGGPNDIYSTDSNLYQYQYISFNAGQLYYGLEGERSGYYSVPQKPNSSIYFDVQ
jgi:hypothetical protein